MDLNLAEELKGYDGTPLMVGEGNKATALTLRWVCCNALVIDLQGDDPKGGDKFERAMLAGKLYDKEDPVTLTSDQITMLKDRIARRFPANIVGAAWPLLDPAEGAD